MNLATEINDRQVASGSSSPAVAKTAASVLLLWLLFLLICFGLGYPTLNRYQPSHVEGLSDSAMYYQMVTNTASARPLVEVFEARVLVPFIARPFYRLAKTRLHNWDPVYFGLLMSNSIFCATTALLLVGAGLVVTDNAGTALTAAMLYLLSFAIPNLQLAGLVDSGEACFMMLLVFAMLTKRWWLLPLIGVGGGLAKETFIVFATIFAITWWIRSARPSSLRSREFYYIIGLVICCELTSIAINYANIGQVVLPWHIWSTMNAHPNYVDATFRFIFDRSFWYVFLWLLPLGLWGSRHLHRPWIAAASLTGIVALLLGIYHNMGGTVARPIFNVSGTLLALG